MIELSLIKLSNVALEVVDEILLLELLLLLEDDPLLAALECMLFL